MKKILLATFSVLLIASAAYSQEEQRQSPPPHHQGPGGPGGPGHMDPEHMERIHALKVAFITDKLRFTSTQSAHFWPIYDEYEKEMHTIRGSFFQKYRNSNSFEANSHEARQYIDDNLDYQEQIIQLKRKYNEQYLKVLSAKQVADLYDAEREFKQMLIQQLRERHGGNGGGGWNGGDRDR